MNRTTLEKSCFCKNIITKLCYYSRYVGMSSIRGNLIINMNVIQVILIIIILIVLRWNVKSSRLFTAIRRYAYVKLIYAHNTSFPPMFEVKLISPRSITATKKISLNEINMWNRKAKLFNWKINYNNKSIGRVVKVRQRRGAWQLILKQVRKMFSKQKIEE